MEKKVSVRMTKWIDANIEYILVNNLSEHKSYSDFVRGAVVREIRRLETLKFEQHRRNMQQTTNSH